MSDFSSVPKKAIEYVTNHDNVSIDNLVSDLKISRVTAKNYLSRMAKMGIIMNVGRGIYRKGQTPPEIPILPSDVYDLTTQLKNRFPMANPVYWSLSMFSDYSHYAIGKDAIFIETTKILSKSIRDAIPSNTYKVVLRPLVRDFQEYAENNRKTIFILERKELYGLIMAKGPIIPTLERMWVDLFYFITRKKFSFSSYELGIIFGNLLKNGKINFNRLTRYASRRGLAKEIIIFLYVLKEKSRFGTLIPDSVLFGKTEAYKTLIELTNGALEI
ncbi:MAG: hypothetical protein NUK63_04425 [Candidatus Bathyarchaeum tardum]|nr:MAG: hypothetical protein NUK63_04425 [Candidatus Bathyarchaeum tardum]